MESYNIRFSCLLCIPAILFVTKSHSQENLALRLGESINLTCNHTFPPEEITMSWRFWGVRSSSDKSRKLSNGTFSNLKDGSVTLSLINALTINAGTYECHVMWTPGGMKNVGFKELKLYSQVIIISSDPVCGNLNSVMFGKTDHFLTIADHANTSMQCSVDYSGNWAPKMTWKRVCGGEVDENLRSSLYVDRSTVVSTLTFTSNREHHGCNFSCLTFFEKPESPKFVSNSSHCPRFRHSCYIQLNVLYGPSELTIFPRRTHLNEGDNLTCSTTANPSALLSWRNTESGVIHVGGLLLIDDDLIRKKPHVFECIAFNNHSTISENITFFVTKRREDGTISPVLLIVILVVLCVVGIGGVISMTRFFQLQRKRKLHGQSFHEPSLDQVRDEVEYHSPAAGGRSNQEDHSIRSLSHITMEASTSMSRCCKGLQRVGGDGTVYSELSIRGRACSRNRIAQDDNSSTYAQVDHLMTIPIPPNICRN